MDLLHLYFRSDGRITRTVYWLASIPFMITAIAMEMVAASPQTTSTLATTLALLVYLAMVVPSLMVSIKRCHDRDRSGWFLLISFIPLIGSLWLLIELGFLRGTQGPNRFGDDPSRHSGMVSAMSA